uniref:Peptidase S54 rhomboid domain-containing protein n=1 Tax=Sander lucioperca TaxID=283035 RepID=A0A8C9ZJ63_SANLU
MLIFRFIVVFRGYIRIGLHGLIFKKHHIFVVLHIAAAPLFTLCVELSVLACVSLQHVFRDKEWRRLFLSPLHHVDDWHLYFNMVSFIWKGMRLEGRLGAAWFLYLLSVFFLLDGLVYMLLQAALTKLIEDSNPFVAFRDECAVGFSGVLFALKVVSNHYNPGGVTYVLHIRVTNRFASWAELVLIYLIAPRSSLVGHLAGILVGLLYTWGPLKTIMKKCAGLNVAFLNTDVSFRDRHPCRSLSSLEFLRAKVAGRHNLLSIVILRNPERVVWS